MKTSSGKTMPALFIGHGNPILTISDNKFTRSWAELGRALPSPDAIMVISAHWYLPEMRVTAMKRPRTIHDFFGFPDELFQIQYPAAGSPELAEKVADLLLPNRFEADQQWGLDHGTWSVLRHLYPQASVPVIQVSLDLRKSAEEHYRTGQKLAALRKEGVLIIGSGNVVHNLCGFDWRNSQKEPPGWAIEFEAWNKEKLRSGKTDELVEYLGCGEMADQSVPSPDHYLPLLYLAALKTPEDSMSFPVEGFDGGTMSMLAALLSPEKSVVKKEI